MLKLLTDLSMAFKAFMMWSGPTTPARSSPLPSWTHYSSNVRQLTTQNMSALSCLCIVACVVPITIIVPPWFSTQKNHLQSLSSNVIFIKSSFWPLTSPSNWFFSSLWSHSYNIQITELWCTHIFYILPWSKGTQGYICIIHFCLHKTQWFDSIAFHKSFLCAICH